MTFGGGKRFAPGRRLLAVLLVLAGLLSFTQSASAAKLSLVAHSGAPSAMTASRCSGDTLAIAITGTVAAVSGIKASCLGKTLRVYIRSAGATISAQGTISGGTANLTLPSSVTAAVGTTATIDTWSVPVTWSVVSPTLPAVSCVSLDDPSLTCNVSYTISSKWPDPPHTYILNAYVTSSSPASKPVRWAVTFNLSSADLPVAATRLKDNQGGLVPRSASACGSTPLLVTVTGTTGWGDYYDVYSGVTRNIQVQASTVDGGNLLSCP